MSLAFQKTPARKSILGPLRPGHNWSRLFASTYTSVLIYNVLFTRSKSAAVLTQASVRDDQAR